MSKNEINDDAADAAEPDMDAKTWLEHGRSFQDLHTFREIGVCHSMFANKRGVPRQGKFAPNTVARIELRKHVSDDALTGLEGFSHVWIIFVFNRNNNNDKVRKWVAGQPGHMFPGKVKPPLLKGQATGVFSSRSPHRPNPIGLTLAKIQRVDTAARELLVTGVDLCDQTPVLDLKPFAPGDLLSPSEVRYPPWVESEVGMQWNVEFHSLVEEQIKALLAEKIPTFYKTVEEIKMAVQDILRLDVRAVHQGRGKQVSNTTETTETTPDDPDKHQFVVDNIQVFFTLHENDDQSVTATVIRAAPYDSKSLPPIQQ